VGLLHVIFDHKAVIGGAFGPPRRAPISGVAGGDVRGVHQPKSRPASARNATSRQSCARVGGIVNRVESDSYMGTAAPESNPAAI